MDTMTDAPNPDSTAPDSVAQALRESIASVEAAIVRLEGEDAAPGTVERVLALVGAPALGDVVARHNAFIRAAAIVDYTGTLPDREWSPLADLGPLLEDTVTRLRTHASALLDGLEPTASPTEHIDSVHTLVVDEAFGETLALLVLIEDCVFLWHRVCIARTGTDGAQEARAAARTVLAEHFEGDADLLRRARVVLARFAEGTPIDVVRRLSSTRTTRTLAALRRDLDDFRAACRADEAGWLDAEAPEVAEALDSLDSPLKAVGGALGGAFERGRVRVTETLSRDDGTAASSEPPAGQG